MENCIFCKIIDNKIPCTKVYEDNQVLAFKDINPEAPIHVLIIPKEHITSVNEINEDNQHIIGHIYLTISKLAKDLGIDKDGYRVVTNIGKNGGQTVNHLHYHLLGGRNLTWPPG
jgi:histidine triad (HIT) family protein